MDVDHRAQLRALTQRVESLERRLQAADAARDIPEREAQTPHRVALFSALANIDELRLVIRQKFKVKKSDFSEAKIKQLWCAIDTDDSDSIAQVEFGRFVKLAKGRVEVKGTKGHMRFA